ncbi:hypothetical protein SAMN04488057_11517 [Cyclobacterium lianum]|uniref:SnoaL-like domain-containing protein n=1 Tax=Cyclobacterium lianum TaxID=388280 RepID=A0A1M7Q7U8_9BACT|nr:hypothetical protein [Cyclobacterium lianum]SHN26675.1 hypothetical protein SAMN04488057_11517 [Cyclobacterium lianum]
MVKILRFLFIFVSFSHSIQLYAQIEEEIRTAGQIYAYAQLHGDHEILLDFTYPTLIEKAGGRDAMKNILKQIQETKEKKGQHLTSVEFGEQIEAVTVADEIHAIVPITLVTKVPGGTLTNTSNLIAVGTENRGNWYFIETTSLEERNIKKVLPNWDHSLTLPFKKPPVFKEDKR